MAIDPDPTRGIPEPPWRRAPRSPRRRATPLTREAIVEAALTVLDREGLDALSMRLIAQQLGTGAASLYWHVSDKDELLDLLFDRVVGELRRTVPAPDPARWQQQLKDVLRAVRTVLARHPAIARVALDRFPLGPNTLLWNERLLAILQAGGLPNRTCAYASQLLPSYVGWFALEESLRRGSPPADGADPEAMRSAIRSYLASLPADRFPITLAMLDDFVADDMDDRFEFGIDVLIHGLTAHTA